MDTQLGAALVGAIAAALFVYLYELYKDRRDRGRIASALLVEVVAQAEFINVLSRAAHIDGVLPVRETFLRYLPAKPTMFEALAGQLPLLGARPSSCVVACYGSLAWARSLIESLPTTADYASTRRSPHGASLTPELFCAGATAELLERQLQGILERLRQACRGAAFNAILVIRALDEIAPHKRLPNDETAVADMIRKLEGAATLGGERDDEISNRRSS